LNNYQNYEISKKTGKLVHIQNGSLKNATSPQNQEDVLAVINQFRSIEADEIKDEDWMSRYKKATQVNNGK